MYVSSFDRTQEYELTPVQWTVDPQTKMLGWEWIGNDGAVYSSLALYRIGGRMYPVGNLAAFDAATGGPSANKYEVVLKYVPIA